MIVAAALAIGVPWVRDALNTVSTDDAYVNGHVTAARCARITAAVARRFQAILDKNPTSFGQSGKVFPQPMNHPRRHQRA